MRVAVRNKRKRFGSQGGEKTKGPKQEGGGVLTELDRYT